LLSIFAFSFTSGVKKTSASPASITERLVAFSLIGRKTISSRYGVAALTDAEEAYGGRHAYTLLLLECGHNWGLIGTDA